MIKLTIIISVYNSENYLHDCFTSLLDQSVKSKEIEIIIIDDGSVDGSYEIIKHFQKKLNHYYYLTIYQQDNQGIAKTRNKGIELAAGKYIGFLDSDDMFLPQYFEEIINIIDKDESIDLIEINAFKFDKKNDKQIFRIHFLGNGEILLTDHQKKSALESCKWYACFRIIKKEHYINNFFPIVKSYEDQLLYPLIFINCKKIWAIEEPLYYYRLNHNSLTNNLKLVHLKDFFATFKHQLSDVDQTNELLILNSFYNLMVYRYLLFTFYSPHQAYQFFKQGRAVFFTHINKNKLLSLAHKYKIKKKFILLMFFPYLSVIYKYFTSIKIK